MQILHGSKRSLNVLGPAFYQPSDKTQMEMPDLETAVGSEISVRLIDGCSE